MHYKVTITSTGKPVRGSTDDFRVFNTQTYLFLTKDLVLGWLEETYSQKSRRRRRRIFRERSESMEHVGFIYKFRNSDCSHSPGEEWIQEDWVEIVRVEDEVVIL